MPDVDDLLAQHIAHLFIRDSISLFSEKLEQDIRNESDHFEVCFEFDNVKLYVSYTHAN